MRSLNFANFANAMYEQHKFAAIFAYTTIESDLIPLFHYI